MASVRTRVAISVFNDAFRPIVFNQRAADGLNVCAEAFLLGNCAAHNVHSCVANSSRYILLKLTPAFICLFRYRKKHVE